MRIVRNIAIWMAPLLGLTGCYYDIEEDLYPATFCATDNVTWTGTIEPLITSRCATVGCHVPGDQTPDLSTYAGVAANTTAIRQTAVVDKSMPFGSSLSSCQIQQLAIWLDMGAPQN
jgi:hypothetical protein